MGQNCSKTCNKKNSVSPLQDDRLCAKPLYKDAALIFLAADERKKLNKKPHSPVPGPSASSSKKRLRKKAKDATAKHRQGPDVPKTETLALSQDGGMQVRAGTTRPRKMYIARNNQLVSYDCSTYNIIAVNKFLIAKQTKMSHGKASFLAEEIPAPRKIFVVRKTKLSDEKATDITDANRLLRKVVFDEKTKMPFDRSSFAQGSSETPQMPSPARVKIPVPGKVKSRASSQAQVPKMAGRTAFINQMMNQMESKDFQQRIKAIDQLVADCNDNPSMVTSCIFQVFDVIKARLQESNRKVNLHMLEALSKIIPLLKDHLAKVVYILVPAIVESHLNSKNSAIYNAATRAINALTQNLDNALLLEMFVAKAQLLSGQAKADLTEKVADMVIQLHPRKPQMVEQQVLPLLWHLLSSYSNSRATATLCEALHSQMGPRLKMCATLQSLRVEKAVNQLLRTI